MVFGVGDFDAILYLCYNCISDWYRIDILDLCCIYMLRSIGIIASCAY